MPIVTGQIVAGGVVTGAVVAGAQVGAAEVAGPELEEVTFTVVATSFDSRVLRGAMEGSYGPARMGLYWTLPANDDGEDDYYLWETQDDGTGRFCGVDPGPLVAALSGWTGIEVQHAAGSRTAAQRATAIRSALTTADIDNWTIGGSGADVTIEATIDSATCAVAGIIDSTRGQWGTRRRTPQFTGSDLSGRVGSFFVSPPTDVLVLGIGCYFADHSAQFRLALVTGGTQASLAATTTRMQGITTGASTGWSWIATTPAQAYLLPASTNCRLVAKSNSTGEPGYIGTGDLDGTDFTADPLEIYSAVASDPTVAWPASLSGETVGSTSPVYIMMAMQYMEVGTGAVRTTRIGLQISNVADLASTSSLTTPDAGGADLFMGVAATGLTGWEYSAWALAFGTTHATQVRGFIVEGGSVGNAAGGTVAWQAQSSGSTTEAWVETAIAAGAAPHDGTTVIHWAVRNNAATVNFRFSLNASRLAASPVANEADWTDASEYEIFRSVNGDGTGGNVHETNPAVAVASPIATNGGAVATNTNYPGSYLVLRYPADTVVTG